MESLVKSFAQNPGEYLRYHSRNVCSPFNVLNSLTYDFLSVSYELCDPPNSVGGSNSLVGYSTDWNISRSTRLAFVTNGIALRMLESGSGDGGQGTTLDDITVGSSFFLSSPH